MRYTIDPEVFAKYPGFTRAVIIADNIDNTQENADLAAELRRCETSARESLDDSFKELPKLAVWAEAFRSMNLNPNRFPPSVVNLIKRARSGKDLPYVNSLVAAFNCVSLKNLCPCGGDDLSVVEGDLALTFAKGDETYVPLGQPDVKETPPAGEIIYMDTATKDVFCRAWCWKNGDRSKLSPATSRAAVNVDFMPPMGMEDAERIAAELAAMLQQYTGASTAIHYLHAGNTEFTI
ncbi:MAG: hypothetical protein DELT_00250 [Desulfovibrio sp.]